MSTSQEFLDFINYKCEPNEQVALQEIEQYLIKKYNVSFYKLIIYNCDEGKYVFHIITNSTEELLKISQQNGGMMFFFDDEIKIGSILKKHKINKTTFKQNGKLVVFVQSFESLAVHLCYYNSFYEYKEFRERIFNDKTMHRIDGHNLIVYYKNQEYLDQAIASGETEYIKEEYYKILKEYDVFNMISRDKHFFTLFDIASNEMHPLARHDMVAEYLLYN